MRREDLHNDQGQGEGSRELMADLVRYQAEGPLMRAERLSQPSLSDRKDDGNLASETHPGREHRLELSKGPAQRQKRRC